MAKEGSVAPQERVNITYKPSTGNQTDEVELPLKMLFIGDYTGRADPRPLEERKPVNVDKDNFTQVLAEQNLSLSIHAKDELSGDKGAELAVNLKFKKLSDFGPDAVAEQVPELKRLLELRQAITALKGPLGNVPAFKRKISSLLADDKSREKLVNELGLGGGKDGG
jgi:type VI secretion system protein ImpB